LQKALNASEGTHSLSLTKDVHLLLYRADSGMGNCTSATQHLLRHQLLNDSIFNETKNWQIEELQVQFETAKKEKDIKLLNNQNQLQRISVEQANRTKNITLAYVALLLIIVGLLFNRYRIKQRSNRALKANQKELDQKNVFLETLNAEQDKLLKEKEWLIKEVHHRVKNNLQMVTGLLYSQSVYLEDDAARLAVKDSLRRIQAMSIIHQKLYQDENISTIAMPPYISDLVLYLYESFDAGNRIVFEQTIEPLALDVSQAIPLGLIITESIVNAIKYAFLHGQEGIVRINLQYDGADHLLLSISDNGVGIPTGLDAMEHNSLGLDLMQGLTKQLKGSFHIANNQGVHITVRFKIVNKSIVTHIV
jgi:two-component sensor histidine kinase